MTTGSVLSRRAIQLIQDPAHPVYMFALTGDEILQIADVSRLGRGDAGNLIGYQRPEVRKHVDNIVDYLNGPDVLFPNSIILALSPDVRFTSSRGPGASDGLATAGHLDIPLSSTSVGKPAWIVDGQQRTLALSKAKNRGLAVPIIGFVADTVALQRDQFVRINSAQPLPRGLVTELLPEISVPINPRLAARRIPSALVDQLNLDPASPFVGLIRRSSSTATERKSAVVTDTSLVNALEESLTNPSGCLFPYRNLASGETDFEGIWAVLNAYWWGVRDTFPDAWGRAPGQSRLMHGVGIRAMGRLMDRVMATVDAHDDNARAQVRDDLTTIAPFCHWTSGTWDELGMAWNELQNVPRHIRVLSNHLVRLYLSHRQDGP